MNTGHALMISAGSFLKRLAHEHNLAVLVSCELEIPFESFSPILFVCHIQTDVFVTRIMMESDG